MRRLGVIGFLLCAACHSPGPQMQDVPATKVVVGADSFDLRRQGPYMQAIRRNLRGIPRMDQVARNAEHAMEKTSGCDVAWLVGDVAVLLGGMQCKGAPAPPRPKGTATYVFCDVSESNDAYVVACYD